MTATQLPPHSLEAEQSVIGAILLDNRAFEDIGSLRADDFYNAGHRQIIQAAAAMLDEGRVVDIFTLADKLDGLGELEEVGGIPYLAAVARDTPSVANVGAYAAIVVNLSRKRRLFSTAMQISQLAFTESDADIAVAQAENLLQMISEQSANKDGPEQINGLLTAMIEDIDRRFNSGGEIIGTSTGFSDIDKLTGGLIGGEFFVVAGSPGMGKSTLVSNIVSSVILKAGKPALYWSGEMGGLQVVRRTAAEVGGINRTLLRNGQLLDDDWPKLTSAIAKLNDKPLYVDSTPGLSVQRLRANVSRLMRKAPLGLLVVDYLQIMVGHGDNRVQEVASVSRGLKRIATEFNVPVIAVASLNREVAKRPNKRPQMSDLRECGDIEFDADLIAFVYRDEVFNPDTKDKGFAEVIFRKIREGSPQTVPFYFRGEIGRFEPVAGGIPSWSEDDRPQNYGFM